MSHDDTPPPPAPAKRGRSLGGKYSPRTLALLDLVAAGESRRLGREVTRAQVVDHALVSVLSTARGRALAIKWGHGPVPETRMMRNYPLTDRGAGLLALTRAEAIEAGQRYTQERVVDALLLHYLTKAASTTTSHHKGPTP